MIKLSFLHYDEDVHCKLCGELTRDIPVHFLISCHNLCKSRDKYLDQIVNILNVRDYVMFSDMDDYDQCDFLLEKRHVGEIERSEQEWELFVLHSARHLGLAHDKMRTLLSV